MIYYIDGWQIKPANGWTVHPGDPEVLEFKQAGEITQYAYKPKWSSDRGELVQWLKNRQAEQLLILKDEIAELQMLVIE